MKNTPVGSCPYHSGNALLHACTKPWPSFLIITMVLLGQKSVRIEGKEGEAEGKSGRGTDSRARHDNSNSSFGRRAAAKQIAAVRDLHSASSSSSRPKIVTKLAQKSGRKRGGRRGMRWKTGLCQLG